MDARKFICELRAAIHAQGIPGDPWETGNTDIISIQIDNNLAFVEISHNDEHREIVIDAGLNNVIYTSKRNG